ncbi:MAG TPA: universal stress protein [Brumimicrobium sp.]|nr:universal stress protein [Brumimicrobium sp.]
MKKILVPTDFSDFALNAAKLAANLARKFDARIYFLHAVTMPQYATGGGNQETYQDVAEGLFILKKVKMDFENLLNQDFLKGINVVTAIQYNTVYENIVKQSKEHDIDLIVMGTHGTSGYVNDFFIGSNTDKIVRRSEIPVITVRKEVEKYDFEKIVFASDFGEGVSNSFGYIANFANSLGAKIDLVRIITRDDFYYSGAMLDIMENFAKDNGLRNYECHIYTAENVQTGINEFALRHGADMVATVTNGRRGLARLFNGSVTTEIMNSSALPVMTLKTQK